MFRNTILALTAVAALTAGALAPTTASAKSWKGGWHGHHHHFNHGFWGGPRIVVAPAYYGGCYQVKRWVNTHWGPQRRYVTVCG